MNFSCSWDSTVIGITIAVSILLLVIAICAYFKLKKYTNKIKLILVWAVCIGGFLPALFTPLQVSVQAQSIRIHQLKGYKIIPVQAIREIRLSTLPDTKNSIRTFGSGGFFGYLGKFTSPQLGKYQIYATNTSNRILIKTDQETIIFSCDNPEKLIQLVTQ